MSALRSVSHGATPTRSATDHRGGAGRALLVASVGPLVIGYLATAALLALVTASASGSDVSTSGVLATAAPAWLAAYHVPVSVTGHELGVLPLLPTALVLLLVARTAGNTARRLGAVTPRSAVRIICVIGLAHALFAAALATLCSGGPVAVSPVVAFFVAGVFGALAAAIGTARQAELVDAVLDRTDPVTEAGLRAGGYAVIALVGVGAAVFALGLLASWSTAVALFRGAAPGFGSGLGMFLLSAAYLPNVVIGTLSFVAGPGFAIGQVAVGQWRFHSGAVPALPLLAPLPAAPGHWWVFLMLLPAGVGVLVGLACVGYVDRLAGRLRAVLVAALAAGGSWLVLAALAGGALAGGPFDPVTVPAGLLAVSVFAFVAVFGVVTVWLAGRNLGLSPVTDEFVDDEPVDDESVAEPAPEESAETEEPVESDESGFDVELGIDDELATAREPESDTEQDESHE